MRHTWRTLAAADSVGWSALALVAGENTGPGVSIAQCERCGVVRLEPEGSEEPSTYGDRGELRFVEPECKGGE
jgi:hypothetical protein